MVHPQRDAVARRRLARGAEPFGSQRNCNISFHGRVLWFLELVHEISVCNGRQAAWDDPAWTMLDMGGDRSGARWMLDIAEQLMVARQSGVTGEVGLLARFERPGNG